MRKVKSEARMELSSAKKGTSDAVRVMVRVRPFHNHELESDTETQVTHLKIHSETLISSIHINNPMHQDDFPFDRVFWSVAASQIPSTMHVSTQEDIFHWVGEPTLECALEGYNACIFAYGQTSSGKTYTMMGEQSGPHAGLVPRLLNRLFSHIKNEQKLAAGLTHSTDDRRKVDFKVEISFIEIYNEKVKDLLYEKRGDSGKIDPNNLEVYQDPKQGPCVKGLSIVQVRNWEEVDQCLIRGGRQRIVAATAMNERSSRSHALVQLTVTQEEVFGKVGAKEVRKSRKSRMNLVDLAGSEKVDRSGVEGVRLTEAININKSLTVLGRVIDGLVEGALHVPYRDAVLTHLLSDSLGGNSRTTMLAMVSPANINYEETLSTLRYAVRARRIVNVVKINEDPTAQLIRELQEELAKFKGSGGTAAAEHVIQALKEREEKDQKALMEREEHWAKEREEIQDKHTREVEELKALHYEMAEKEKELLVKQEALEGDIQAWRKKSVVEKFSFGVKMSVAQAQAQEAVAKQEQLRKELVIQRFKSATVRAKLESTAGLECEELRREISRLESTLSESNNRLREAEWKIVELEMQNQKLSLNNSTPTALDTTDNINQQPVIPQVRSPAITRSQSMPDNTIASNGYNSTRSSSPAIIPNVRSASPPVRLTPTPSPNPLQISQDNNITLDHGNQMEAFPSHCPEQRRRHTTYYIPKSMSGNGLRSASPGAPLPRQAVHRQSMIEPTTKPLVTPKPPPASPPPYPKLVPKSPATPFQGTPGRDRRTTSPSIQYASIPTQVQPDPSLRSSSPFAPQSANGAPPVYNPNYAVSRVIWY